MDKVIELHQHDAYVQTSRKSSHSTSFVSFEIHIHIFIAILWYLIVTIFDLYMTR